MTEKIIAYYDTYKTQFEENFSMVLDNFDVEAIHKMRTSTKRLRALFLLMEYLSGGDFKAKKQLKRIRKLFKFSGRIREIQIEAQLLIHYANSLEKAYPEYTEYLKIREHREIARFLKHLPKPGLRDSILNDKKIRKAIAAVGKTSLEPKTKEFLKDKKKTLKSLSAKPPSNHRIHSCRTQLKQLYYLFDILTDLTGTTGIFGMTNLKIREHEQYLGDWHDMVNSPVYMNAFMKTKQYTGDKKYVELKNQIAIDRKNMREQIITNIYPALQAMD